MIRRILFALLLLPTLAFALTGAQLDTLKAAITGDPVLSAFPAGPDGAWALADYLNQPKTPAIVVWATSVSAREIIENGFVWSRIDGLTAGKREELRWLLFELGTLNASKVNIRSGIDDACGSAADLKASIYAHLKRNATRAEALFAAGSGTDASPATMGWEGQLVYTDVEEARRRP